MPDKANNYSRERKKTSSKKNSANNIYSSKHIRNKEALLLSKLNNCNDNGNGNGNDNGKNNGNNNGNDNGKKK